jgi:hypothetical protein
MGTRGDWQFTKHKISTSMRAETEMPAAIAIFLWECAGEIQASTHQNYPFTRNNVVRARSLATLPDAYVKIGNVCGDSQENL